MEQQVSISLHIIHIFIYLILSAELSIIGFFVFPVFRVWKISDFQKRNGLWCSLWRTCRLFFHALTMGVEFFGSE